MDHAKNNQPEFSEKFKFPGMERRLIFYMPEIIPYI